MKKIGLLLALAAVVLAPLVLTGCNKTEEDKAVMEAEKTVDAAAAKVDAAAAKPKDHPAH